MIFKAITSALIGALCLSAGVANGSELSTSNANKLENKTTIEHNSTESKSSHSAADNDSEIGLDSTRVIDIEQVVVSSSRNETTKRTAATIVNVASRQLFENSGANSVAEVLNFQPGLRVEYNCSNCGFPQLRINGLAGEYSQIMLDSQPIFSSLAGVYGLEQLPESMIERVEVVRGGGSALFGSSAIAGTVNIITREPKRSGVNISNQTAFFEGGGSDINTSINASVVSKHHDAGIYIFSMVRDRDAYDRNGDGYSELAQLKSTTVGFRGFYRVSPSSRFTLEYHHINEYRRGGDSIHRPVHNANQGEELKHRINGGSIKYDYFSPNLRSRLNAYVSAQNIDRDSYFGTNQNLDAYGKTFDATVVSGVQYSYEMPKCLFMPAQFTAGFEYNNNFLNDEMLGYNRTLIQNSESYGLYLQNEWRNDKTTILIGARLDKHNMVEHVVFAPRVSLRYAPIEPLTFRASYSSGYRAPQAYNEDLHVSAVGGEVAIISISPDLRPEYSHSVTLSADYFKSWQNLTLNITAEGFYTNLLDVFVLKEIGHDNAGNLLLERQNEEGAIIAGINFETRLNWANKLSADLGFTYQISRYKAPLEWSQNPNLAPQKVMFRSPDTYGYLALNYTPIPELSIGANCTYTGSMLVQHMAGYIAEDTEVNTPEFFDMGMKFAYDFKFKKSHTKLQINCGVKNLFDQFQNDLDRGIGRDAGFIYGPVFPRTYFIGAKFTI